MRKFIHIDMDAFYASVEQRDDPSLRGRPVVVAWRGARSVVCAASYEARVFGVRSAMPAVRAERLCPDAVFVPPDFSRYKAVSAQVRAILLAHTDLVEPLSLDEAYLDVTAPKSALASATAIAQAIRAQIREETQLTASAGVAPAKFLAKIASDWRKPDGLFVIRPHEVEAFLTPLPVARIPGVGKVMDGKLAALGIRTVGELRAFDVHALEARFGRYGRRLAELARGIDRGEQWQPERSGLAGAGLRHAGDVTAVEERRNGRCLDRGRLGEPQRGHCVQELAWQPKGSETVGLRLVVRRGGLARVRVGGRRVDEVVVGRVGLPGTGVGRGQGGAGHSKPIVVERKDTDPPAADRVASPACSRQASRGGRGDRPWQPAQPTGRSRRAPGDRR